MLFYKRKKISVNYLKIEINIKKKKLDKYNYYFLILKL